MKCKASCPMCMFMEVKKMPDRDGKGPRKRSIFPSKKKGGRKLGDCK